MTKSYKNFWSLNTDEAVVSTLIRDFFDKNNVEVFMPLNAQMKDIDLILINMESQKVISLQVKGSKGFDHDKKSCCSKRKL
jgi:hypothetical protein